MKLNMVIILVSLMLSLFFVGLGYASWQDYTFVSGSVSIATLDAEIYLDGLTQGSGEGYEVHGNGKAITITFDSESFGGSLTKLYTVRNTGTIPVRVSTSVTQNDPDLNVINNFSGTVLETNGDTATGWIEINLPEEEESPENADEETENEAEEEDNEQEQDNGEEQNQEKEIKQYSVTIRLEYGMWQ